MKKIVRKISFGLVLIIIACLFSPSEDSTAALTNSVIKGKENEIKEAEKQINSIKNGITKVEDILDGLQDQKKDLAAYIVAIDNSMTEVQDKIDDLSVQIEEQIAMVEATRLELENAINVEKKQYADMKERIRFMYESGVTLYLEILFSADSFSDFLTRTEYVTSLTDYDRKMLFAYQDTVELVEMTKLELEAKEALLEQAKVAQEEELVALQQLQEAKRNELNKTNSDILTAKEQIDDYEAELQAMKDTIETLEKEIEEEKKKLLAAQIRYDGGKFVWPIKKYTRVTSEYGWRNHPTLGVPQFHNGIDLGSAYGTPIYAAYNGKVVAASYTSVMGKYIMIDHGDGIYTVYMHCSKLHVKQGDIVVAGETIAGVGSTGRSTGNHLHFSVRVNGQYVSPWNYIKEPK